MATTPDFSVSGKHVLITGGTGGIGGAFAKAFLDHGAYVIAADIAAPKDRAFFPGRAHQPVTSELLFEKFLYWKFYSAQKCPFFLPDCCQKSKLLGAQQGL